MLSQNINLRKNILLSFFVNILIKFFEFYLVFALARLLGAIYFGKYIFIVSLLKFLGLPFLVGYPYFILRKSSYIKTNKSYEFNNLINVNLYLVTTYLLVLSLFIFFLNFLFPNLLNDKYHLVLFGMISIVPALSINNSLTSIIRSSGKEIKGQVLGNMIPNIIFILFIFSFEWIYKLNSHSTSIILYSASSVLALLYTLSSTNGLVSWARVNIKNIKNIIFKDIRESFPLILFESFALLNNILPLIVLGIFSEPEIVGNYKLAFQISSITGLALHASNKIVEPRIAKSFISDNFHEIQNIALRSNRFISIFAIFFSTIIFLFYKKFVILYFGSDFLIPKITFFLILLSPFFNSIFGPIGSIMNMTGNEKVACKWCGISLFVGIILNFLLIPVIGINGAAIAFFIASFIRGFALWKKSLKLLNVKSSFILNSILKF